MKGNRLITVVFLTAFLLCCFSGCGIPKEEPNTLRIMYGKNIPEKFMVGLQEKFPEIHFEMEFYQGAYYTEYAYQTLIHGETSDIFPYSICLSEEESEQYLMDLSGYTFLGSFDNALLDTMAKKGHVYQIPGPVSTRCILYNKSLFEMYGWKVPATFNELLATVRQIRNDAPDITPIAMGMVATGYPFTIVTSFAQCGFLSTPEGLEWEQNFFKGQASVAEGFDEGFTMVEQLIDADAFDGEKYKDSWSVVGGDPCKRKAAMSICLSGTQAILPLLEKTADAKDYGEYCNDDFGVLPFFGVEDGQQGLSLIISSTWGINKRLEEARNEQKLQNALKVMEFISTVEGQQLLQTDDGQIPTIKNLKNTNVHPEIQKLWNLNQNGKKSMYLYSGYEDIIVDGGQIIKDAILSDSSEGMRKKFVETCDTIHKKHVLGETALKTYGKVDENLSIEETEKFTLAAVQEISSADFALATHRGIFNGVINNEGVGGRLFTGEQTESMLNVVIPNYGTTIETVELTGKEVRMLLQNGKTIVKNNTEATFRYMAYGLEVTEKDGVLQNVYLNGDELKDNQIYTVNFIQGDYNPEFAASHTIHNTDIIVFDAISEYMSKMSPITKDKIK